MDIFEYIEVVNTRMKKAHEEGDNEEALRLLKLLKETIEDRVKQWKE